MYERYCNKIDYLSNPFVVDKVLNIHCKNTGYYLDKNEKFLTFEELIQYDQEYLKCIEGDNPGLLKYYLSTIYNNKFIGVPYKNILSESDIIYYDPRLLHSARSSTGMAAGNNFKEAFIQGFSEVLEHHYTGMYLDTIFDKYYELDLNNIQNESIKNSIKNIQDAGKTIKIYDISYNINLPVLMSVIISPGPNLITVNISSFPVFDIALERVITETYQGANNLSTFRQEGQFPFKGGSLIRHLGTSTASTTLINAFPEEIFFRTKKVQKHSTIFLDQDNYTNDDIFLYLQNLCKQHNLNVYYYNNSYSKDIVSLSILATNLSGLRYYRLNSQSDKKIEVYKTTLQLYQVIKDITLNNKIDSYQFRQCMKNISNFNTDDDILFASLTHDNWLMLFNLKESTFFNKINYLYSTYPNYELMSNVINNFSKDRENVINKYFLLYKYVICKKYSTEEIQNIMDLFNITFSEEEYKNISNIDYLLTKIFLIPLQTDYNSNQEYFNILAQY